MPAADESGCVGLVVGTAGQACRRHYIWVCAAPRPRPEASHACSCEQIAQMPSFIAKLTEDEKNSLQRIHQAVRNNVQRQTLASILNETILKGNNLLGYVEALDKILKVNNVHDLGNNSEAWTHLIKTAKEYMKQDIRTKQKYFISMQWSLELMARYGWDAEELSRDKLAWVYNCATIWPSFEKDFIPQVNLVRYLKHCSALSALEAPKTKEDAFAPRGSELAAKDLYEIQKLKKNRSVLIYGREVTLETAGQLQGEIRGWTENQTGVVCVGSKQLDLKEKRPYHWNIYLLKFNENGLLVRRELEDRAATPRRDGILTPPASMFASTDDRARFRTGSPPSAVPFSTEESTSGKKDCASDDTSDSAVDGAEDIAGGSSDHVTADSAAEATSTSPKCTATAHAKQRLDVHGTHHVLDVAHSSADDTISHSSTTCNMRGTPTASSKAESSKPGSPPESPCLRRSARACHERTAVKDSSNGLDDHASAGDDSNDQESTGISTNRVLSQDKDAGDEGSGNASSGDLSPLQRTSQQTPASTSGVGQECPEEETESTRFPGSQSHSEYDARHGTTSDDEAVAFHGRNAEASVNVLSDQADKSHAAVRDEAAMDFNGIESWLIGQGQDGSLFVGNSPTSVSDCRSTAPEALSLAQTRASQIGTEALQNETLATQSVAISTEDGDEDTSTSSAAGCLLPATTHGQSEIPLVPSIVPEAVATQGNKTTSFTPTKDSSSDATSTSAASGSSSELTSEQHAPHSNAARTTQNLASSSSEWSSDADRPSPTEASPEGNGAKVWPGLNTGDLSSPFKFVKTGHQQNQKSSVDSGALADMLEGKISGYLTLMPPSVFAPHISHASSEERGQQKWWHAGDGFLSDGLRGRVDDDLECSDHSDCTSRNSPDPPHTHFAPRPADCTCDTCKDIEPFLKRIRSEASSNDASRFCRARGRWFGSAKWASATRVFDVDEAARQSDCEVMYVDHASFQEMADEDLTLDKPIVVRKHQRGTGVPGIGEMQRVLRDSYGDLTVTMTDTLVDASIQVGMEDFLTRFSDDQWSIGSSTLRNSFGTQNPAFLSYARFRLLQSAVTRASCHPVGMVGSGTGCENLAHPICVNGGLSFNRVESSGAFSGPCLGALGGTWLHVLEGRRLCAFIPRKKLTTSFRAEFVRKGLEWQPQNEQRLVLLEPNDLLILPADVVCTQLAVDPGVSLEGAFWDERDWGRYFTAAHWAAVNPTHVTTQIPHCANRLALYGLKRIARDDPQRFASDAFTQEFLETDRSHWLDEIVMAGRCSPGLATEHSSPQGSNASRTAGSRRMSEAQPGDELPAKRLCIRKAPLGAAGVDTC